MGELLNKAKRRLHVAKFDKDEVYKDYKFMDMLGFDLHQAVVLILMDILDTNGIEYKPTHDIQLLISYLPVDVTQRYDISELEKIAGEITSWHSSMRKSKFWADLNDINKVFSCCEGLIVYADETGKIPEGAIEWCRENAPDALKDSSVNELWLNMQSAYRRFKFQESISQTLSNKRKGSLDFSL